MLYALDTNILAYAEGMGSDAKDGMKIANARKLLDKIPNSQIIIPIQALGELYHVLTRKGRRERDVVSKSIEWWLTYKTVDTTRDITAGVLTLATQHKWQIWDAIIMAAAAKAKCDVLLSEDMQQDFVWQGVTVVNPFAEPLHPLLVL